MINCIDFSNIKKSYIIKIHKSTVVSEYFWNCFSSMCNFSLKVLLCPVLTLSNFIKSINVIFFISEFNFARNPLIEFPKGNVVISINRVVENNGLAIVKFDCLMASWNHNSWIYVCFHRIFVPPVHDVFFIRPFYQNVTSWWVMTCLLNIDHSSISWFSLVCFSQYWIQRFFKLMALPKERNCRCDYCFHSLDRVVDTCCIVHVKREYTLNFRNRH